MKKKLFFVLAGLSLAVGMNGQTLFAPGGTGANGVGASQNSNVGIATTDPQALLHIRTPNYNTSGFKVESDNAILEFANHALDLKAQASWVMVPYIAWITPNGQRQAYIGWEPSFFNLTLENGFNFGINGGNVLIGKTSQANTAYKLDVAGKIRADEIVVNTTGADFVFEPNYKLRSLSEVETFIKQHKHLPDVAPAAEMQTNGVNVGDMQKKLLEKVEQLTLYVIEQEKTIKQQNERIEELEKKLVNTSK